MMREMTGQELLEWVAWYEMKGDTQRAQAMDAKGKAKLAAMMGK